MRTIKFRAWDKKKKVMYKPTHEAYRGNLFELMIGFSGDLLAHTMEGVDHESKFPDRFELMQFTGLKDKNGKEIFEGDIVKRNHRGTGEEFPKIKDVKWINDVGHCGFNITVGKRCEVVGNVYENPELLKDKQN